MSLQYLLGQGLLYGIIVTGYLLIMMISISPRVWGYNDHRRNRES